MKDFIEQIIVELQNAKTATEITQCANYFINILAENAQLTERLKNEKHRANTVDQALKLMAKRCSTTCIYGKDKIIDNSEKEIAYYKQEAEAQLAELNAKENL